MTLFAEHIDALDKWISNGGFLPDAWAKANSDELSIPSIAMTRIARDARGTDLDDVIAELGEDD